MWPTFDLLQHGHPRLERDTVLFRDIDPLARPGIASLMGGTSLNLEDAEAAQLKSAVGCQRFQDDIQDPLDNRPGFHRSNAEISADRFDDFFLAHA